MWNLVDNSNPNTSLLNIHSIAMISPLILFKTVDHLTLKINKVVILNKPRQLAPGPKKKPPLKKSSEVKEGKIIKVFFYPGIGTICKKFIAQSSNLSRESKRATIRQFMSEALLTYLNSYRIKNYAINNLIELEDSNSYSNNLLVFKDHSHFVKTNTKGRNVKVNLIELEAFIIYILNT
ncbi:hypothetical protein DPV78_012718 [Talaromyces pinophilus]|nr:hypothetical protein DPV78_012718 [Talaromyces pinophilus]